MTAALPMTVALSSRALFDLDEDASLFDREGLAAYAALQETRVFSAAAPGAAFPLARRLLALNRPGEPRAVRVVVASGQHPFTGRRVMAGARHHGLDITQAAFRGGSSVAPVLRGMGADLFLTRSAADAQAAIDAGVAAAVLGPLPGGWDGADDGGGPLRVALDGDAVIFDDACEAVARRDGLPAFLRRERSLVDIPMDDGPFGRFFRLLHGLRSARPGEVRILLVTARDGWAADRAINTLRHWGCEPDEAFFLGEIPKGPLVAALRPHIFLDDAERHVAAAAPHAPSGRVPYRSDGAVAGIIAAS